VPSWELTLVAVLPGWELTLGAVSARLGANLGAVSHKHNKLLPAWQDCYQG